MYDDVPAFIWLASKTSLPSKWSGKQLNCGFKTQLTRQKANTSSKVYQNHKRALFSVCFLLWRLFFLYKQRLLAHFSMVSSAQKYLCRKRVRLMEGCLNNAPVSDYQFTIEIKVYGLCSTHLQGSLQQNLISSFFSGS